MTFHIGQAGLRLLAISIYLMEQSRLGGCGNLAISLLAAALSPHLAIAFNLTHNQHSGASEDSSGLAFLPLSRPLVTA